MIDSLQSWASLVAQVGFPIVVCGYLLWERRTSYRAMSFKVGELTDAVWLLLQEIHFNRTGKLLERSKDRRLSP